MSLTEITSSIGGFLVFVFAVYEVIEKLCGGMEWYQKLRKKRLAKEKAKQEEIADLTTKKIIDQILPPIIAKIDERDNAQDQKLSQLLKSSNDMLRKDIIRIYYKYLPYKRILQYDKEFIAVAYKDYHDQGGNTFIDGIVQEINLWLVVNSEEDLGK